MPGTKDSNFPVAWNFKDSTYGGVSVPLLTGGD